jgi:RND family efflux transporter MFP subunit
MKNWGKWCLGMALIPLAGCEIISQAQPTNPANTANNLVAVDVAIAKKEAPANPMSYVGTTAPIQEVAVRSRIEGRVLAMDVNVGDRVRSGQVIAQLDDTTPATAVLQSEAEVAAREAEVAQAYANISAAQARVEEARLNLQRTQADALRLTTLAREGAVPQKTADDAQIAARTAAQSLSAAQSQVSALSQAAQSAESRVQSQRAIVLQQQERFSYTAITAPIDGFVLERVTEPGNLLFAGNEVVRLGDLRQVKVMVMVSELEISKIRPNSPAQIKLDALPNRSFNGRVSRISPAADPVARQIPVEITVNNPDRAIASGQLARVMFGTGQSPQISIPTSALPERRDRNRNQAKAKSPKPDNTATLFVVELAGEKAIVRSRQVKVGERRDGKVQVLAGLREGEAFVSRSGGKLKDGDEVRVSALSELKLKSPPQPAN